MRSGDSRLVHHSVSAWPCTSPRRRPGFLFRRLAASLAHGFLEPFFAPQDAWFNINNPAMINYREGMTQFARLINRKIEVFGGVSQMTLQDVEAMLAELSSQASAGLS